MIRTLLDSNDVMLLLRGMVLYRNEDGTPANPPAGKTTGKGHAAEIAITPTALEGLRKLIPRELWVSPDFDQLAEDRRQEQG